MPSEILEPDMVNVTEPPSSTDVADSDTLTVGVTSPIVTLELVVTPGPDVDPVRTVILNCSPDSVSKSVAIALTIVATPVVDPVLTILNEPVRELFVKSAALAVPFVL